MDQPVPKEQGFCHLCSLPDFPLDFDKLATVITHFSAHILFDPTISHNLCGLCLGPADLCQFYLKKTPGGNGTVQIDYNNSRCKNLPVDGKKLKYASASQSTRASPCSNIPVPCPDCPPRSAAIWRYNLPYHQKMVHPGLTRMTSKGWDVGSIEKFERDSMQTSWANRRNVPKPRKKPGTKALGELVISEEYSSEHALRSE